MWEVLELLVLPPHIYKIRVPEVCLSLDTTARWVEVGGGIICVTLEEFTGMHIIAHRVFM